MIRIGQAIIISALLALLIGCGGSESVEELRKTGKKAFLEQDYSKARNLFLKGITIAPSDKDLLYFTALCYQRDFVYDSALFYLKRADLLYPDDRELNQTIREVALTLGEWKDAIHATYVLAETGDGYEQYFSQIAEMWNRAGSSLNALYWIRKAMDSQPDNPNWYLQTANFAAICDSFDLAITIMDSALHVFGEDFRFIANKATYYSHQGRYEEAEKLLRPIATCDTANAAYRLNLAHTLSSQKSRSKKREALKIYREIQSEIDPGHHLDSLITKLEQELK